MWIQNVSLRDIQKGDHKAAGDNTILIQICDPCYEFPLPKQKFLEIYQFEFLDIERDFIDDSFKITTEQATKLVRILQHAFERNLNVIVHCHAGICRSGAVAEVGIMMGFEDTEVFRAPNLLVKHSMMKVLGWTYELD